jgi:hypothetical protein
MGLGKYRPYKDEFHDEGYEKSNSTCRFCTSFYNRNTIQVWDVSSVASVVRKWKGVTLETEACMRSMSITTILQRQ